MIRHVVAGLNWKDKAMDFTFSNREFKGDIVYETDFSNIDDFWTEGSPKAKVENGELEIETVYDRTGDFHWVQSVFLNKVFTGNLMAEYKGMSLGEKSHRNFNFFIHTLGPDGKNLYETRGERTGDYGDYHVLDNYLFTCLRSDQKQPDGTDMFRYRLRRDPGFQLRKEAHGYECVNDRWYTFQYLVKGGEISVCVDELPHETYTWHDDAPLTSGYVGFRTYMSRLRFKDFKIYRVE